MELRQLFAAHEREIFAKCVAEARAKHGCGARETNRSQLGKSHLSFANLYALFEKQEDPLECMIAGFSMHDLEMLPQSYPKPDLTHLPPESVFECGDFWSFAMGGGLLALYGAATVCTLLDVQAALIYALVKPWDTTKYFARVDFERVGEPFRFPYAQALDGGKVWAQAMVLQGDNLRKWTRLVAETGFEALDDCRCIRFANPFLARPSLRRSRFPLNKSQVPTTNSHREEAVV